MRKLMGKVLQFCGDMSCTFALILEDLVLMSMVSDLFWKLGQWFYISADKYGWSYILSSTKIPTKKYIQND